MIKKSLFKTKIAKKNEIDILFKKIADVNEKNDKNVKLKKSEISRIHRMLKSATDNNWNRDSMTFQFRIN